ncbi:MAG: nucleotidyltransferase domain-containing protein [archaeon]
MNDDIEILRLLLGKKEENFTIRKIAEALKINYRTAYEKTALLEKENLIKMTRIGNSKICELTQKFNSKTYEAEYLRREALFKNKDFLVLHNRLAELEFGFIALIFGSYAKETATKHSDIDLLTIGGDEKRIRSVVSLLPDKIHLTAISYASFLEMVKTGKFTVVSEAIKNNIILLGAEEYYRMLSNADRQ